MGADSPMSEASIRSIWVPVTGCDSICTGSSSFSLFVKKRDLSVQPPIDLNGGEYYGVSSSIFGPRRISFSIPLLIQYLICFRNYPYVKLTRTLDIIRRNCEYLFSLGRRGVTHATTCQICLTLLVPLHLLCLHSLNVIALYVSDRISMQTSLLIDCASFEYT